jgi:tetratricopeptide (TPR) repeat protein
VTTPQPPDTATGAYNHADFALGSVLGGRFRIDAMLGVGGMGMVYRATDLDLDVPVALKLLRPELADRTDAFERFRQELLLARQVSNPHVVRIHDLARHDDRWLISMDFIDGESLDRRLDRDGPMPVAEAVRIARQLAEGLAAAHAKDVVHRDLKPANVLLDRDGNAYIGDFGIARSLASTGLTQAGAVVGTPEYLSPEQARGDRVDARSDLYALGLIVYEMLAGKPPFGGGTVAEILAQRLVRSPAPLSQHRQDVPAWLARLVDKLLRPQPAHRFASASEVIAAIDQRRVAREWPRSRGMWLASAIVLVALLAGGWWWWSQRTPATTSPPTVAVAPLQRLMVLPIAVPASGSGLAARMAAADEFLRYALATQLAVVDGERSTQALRQANATGAARPDPATLRTVAAASRVLQPGLVEAGDGWRLQAQLHSTGAPVRIDGPVAASPLAALSGWLQAPATHAALGLHSPATLPLPEEVALEAYGASLRALRSGELAAALSRIRVATEAAPRSAQLWLAQADIALAIGEQDLAFDAIERGLAVVGDGAPRLQRRLAAERAALEGDSPAAVAQWRALLQATPDDTFAELNLARARGNGGDFAAALTGLRKLAARDAQDPRAWYELGKFSILQGDAQRAVDEYLVRALVLYKRSGNRWGEAETVNALGIGYARLGQSSDAIEQYRKAATLRHAVGNRRGEATSLRNLGTALTLAGQFEQAAASLAQARTLHAQLDDRAGLAAVENELGLLAEERGDYPAALEAFRRALQAWQQLEDPLGIAQAHDDIGFAHFQLGAYDNAQVFLQQAADEYAALGDQTGTIRARQALGLLAMARGRWSQARDLLQTSLAEAEQQQMPEEAAVGHRHLAELELWQGHLAAAIEQADAAERLFAARDDVRGRSDAALLKAQALLAMHADAEAGKVLDALAPVMATVSVEQRAIAALLRAQLASRAGDAARTQASLVEARRLATQSGIRALQLQVGLQAPRAGLDAETRALGHAGLRLRWLEQAMAAALARNDAPAAATAYREARPRLREGDFLHAFRLHALGARALAAVEDPAGAASARNLATRTWNEVRAKIPAAHATAFEAATKPLLEANAP